MKKVKFAVVGCGHIGKRHAEVISKNSEAELVALVDIKGESFLGIEKFKTSFFSCIEDFFNSGIKVDVVNIATPNGFHAKQATYCLDHGVHVVIEKPMALDKSDAEKVIFKALRVHRHVFTVMQNRYSPPSVWIKELIENEILGKIFMVQLNCYWNRDERYYTGENWHGTKRLDGGTLFTQFSHFIDIMYWLFGDITNIHSRLDDFIHQEMTEFEDSGIITFNFINGGMGSLNYSTAVWDSNLESSMLVIGENGSVKIGGQYMDNVEYCHIRNYSMPKLEPTNPGNDYGHYRGSAQNHDYVIANVIDVLNGRSTITTNAMEGLKVVDIIERIYNADTIKKENREHVGIS